MSIYQVIELMRAVEKECLPWMHSSNDLQLIAFIGRHQERNGVGMTCKQVHLSGLEPIATLQRRMGRLIKRGILRKRRCDHDSRVFYISLSAYATESLKSYATLLTSPSRSIVAQTPFTSEPAAAGVTSAVGETHTLARSARTGIND
jgi:DNA-binding MarR family transcriptional regulator